MNSEQPCGKGNGKLHTRASLPLDIIMLAIIVMILFPADLLRAENISGPTQSEPGSLFVLSVAVSPGSGAVSRLTFEQAKVQYMGLVQPTPEVQQRGDAMLEILPESGKTGSYQIKFLPFPNASAAEFVLVSGSGSWKMNVAFVASVEEKKYHWHVLAGGVLLLVLAFIFWRYQKKHPGLMSTRSLFLNFEELQKAREEYFPKAGSGNASADGDTVPAMTPVTPETGIPERTGQKNETGTLAGCVPVHVSSPMNSAPENRTIEMTVPTEDSTVQQMQTVRPSSGEKPSLDQTGTMQEVGRFAVDSDEPVVPVVSVGMTPSNQGLSGKTIARTDLSGRKTAIAEPVLHIRLLDPTGREFEGRGQEILIGRANDCNILMTAAEVSRKHLLIKREEGKIVAIPQTTSNLTEVNGSRINSAVSICSGDTITLGGTKFTVEIEG